MCSKNQERVKNRPKTDAMIFPFNNINFPRDLYIYGNKKVITPRSEQNPYTYTNPKILNMDG